MFHIAKGARCGCTTYGYHSASDFAWGVGFVVGLLRATTSYRGFYDPAPICCCCCCCAVYRPAQALGRRRNTSNKSLSLALLSASLHSGQILQVDRSIDRYAPRFSSGGWLPRWLVGWLFARNLDITLHTPSFFVFVLAVYTIDVGLMERFILLYTVVW